MQCTHTTTVDHTRGSTPMFFSTPSSMAQEISKWPPGERFTMGIKAGSKCDIVQGALSSCNFYRFSYNSLRWFMKL